MRNYLMIGIGGFCGAILRYGIKAMELPVASTGFPINTLIINILGSFILGLVIAGAAEVFNLKEAEKLGIMTGFIGAFTTFSSISKELTMLLEQGRAAVAAVYISLSVLLGLGAVYAGVKLGEGLLHLRARKE